MRAFAIWAALPLLACAGASHELVSPGTYAISCKRSQSNCWSEAAKVCPGGYDQLDGAGHDGVVMATNSYTGQVTAVPTYKGEMLVRCRP